MVSPQQREVQPLCQPSHNVRAALSGWPLGEVGAACWAASCQHCHCVAAWTCCLRFFPLGLPWPLAPLAPAPSSSEITSSIRSTASVGPTARGWQGCGGRGCRRGAVWGGEQGPDACAALTILCAHVLPLEELGHAGRRALLQLGDVGRGMPWQGRACIPLSVCVTAASQTHKCRKSWQVHLQALT